MINSYEENTPADDCMKFETRFGIFIGIIVTILIIITLPMFI